MFLIDEIDYIVGLFFQIYHVRTALTPSMTQCALLVTRHCPAAVLPCVRDGARTNYRVGTVENLPLVTTTTVQLAQSV